MALRVNQVYEEPGTRRKRKRVCPSCGAWMAYSRPAINSKGVRVMSGQWGHQYWFGDMFPTARTRGLCDEVVIDPEARRPGETEG